MEKVFRISALLGTILLLVASTSLAAPPTANRPAPYPDYQVGGPATLIITTNPVQASAPVFRFRLKNGVPDGPQPKLEGYTDVNGRFEVHLPSVPAGIEGNYTNEQYAVGDPQGPKSVPLNFTVSAPLSVSCVCEHFETAFDQVCLADPNPGTSGPGAQYRYTWTTTPAGHFPNPPGPTSRRAVADCNSGASGPLRVTVQVDRLEGGLVLGSASTTCSGGTPCNIN